MVDETKDDGTLVEPEVSDEVAAKRAEVLAAQGVDQSPDAGMQPAQVSYFGTEEEHTFYLPDGVSYVKHKDFTEGDRKRYLSKTNRDLRIQQRTGDALLKATPGDDRHELLKIAICDWNLLDESKRPMRFNDQNMAKFLNGAPPHIIDLIDKDIREHNKWLTAEITVEQIDAEIETLTKLREEKVKEAEGKGGSSN